MYFIINIFLFVTIIFSNSLTFQLISFVFIRIFPSSCKMAAPQIFWLSRSKFICDRQCRIGKPTDPIIAVIITYMRYKVPIGIIRAPKLVARPSAANRETRSDSHSIDRSLHSVCGRSFRDRCNCAYTSVLIGDSCTARFSATNDCMKSRQLICFGRLQYAR